MAFQPSAFQPSAFQTVPGPAIGTLSAVLSVALTAGIVGAVGITGTLGASFTSGLQVAVAGEVSITGTLSAAFQPSLVVEITGTSDGNIIVIPRDIEGGIGYLVEMECFDRQVNAEATLYFASIPFTTLPGDTVTNQHFAERLKEAGSYDRSMFSTGTTQGQISVGAGYLEIVNNDGELDQLRNRYAFDGYPLRIQSVPRIQPKYSDAVLVFAGTVEQVELSWAKATVRIRDRLTALDVEHQDVLYAGSTVAGGMNEAEGLPDDLKGKGKELAYGAPQLVPATAANPFDSIFGLGADGLEAVEEVRDRGVLLTPTGTNYANIAALRGASIPAGQYATALALGLVRTGSKPVGQLTARPVEKTAGGARTAAQIARRMLLRSGLVEGVDFLATDIAALDALNPAPVGYWMPPEDQTTLTAVQKVLGSVGATIVPDRLGVFRILRFDAPSGYPDLFLSTAEILEGNGGRGLQLLATGDEGRGVPAWRVTVQYARNWYVMNRSELDVATTETFKAFASQEWRTAIAEDITVRAVNRLASDLTYETYLTEEADAQAEAGRLLALHSVPRDRFQVPLKTFLAEHIELGSVVRLQLPRFGLEAGKDFTVIGLSEKFSTNTTTLDLWG
jgi:hypothetical protein